MTFTGAFRSAVRAGASETSRDHAERYGRAALAGECAEMARTTSGRNDRLNRSAYRLGQLADAAGLGEAEIIAALLEAAEASGLIAKRGRPSAVSTIQSGLRAGLADPRDLPPPTCRDGAPAEPRRVDPVEEARRADERERARLVQAAEDRIKAENVRRMWDRARDPQGTLVTRYLAEHRGLGLPDEAAGYAIRFVLDGILGSERGPLMLAAFRDIGSDEVVGLHRTLLDPASAAKRARAMLGRAKGAAIKLTLDCDLTLGLHIAEGVETALAGLAIGLAPMWAMGSTSGIAALPVLGGVHCLTICAEVGEASASAIDECGARWTAAGREVLVAHPRSGSDIADALKDAA